MKLRNSVLYMASNDFNFVYSLYAIKNGFFWKIFLFLFNRSAPLIYEHDSLLFLFPFFISIEEDHEILIDRSRVSRRFHLFIYRSTQKSISTIFKNPTKMTYLTKHIENDELVFNRERKSTVTNTVLHYLC